MISVKGNTFSNMISFCEFLTATGTMIFSPAVLVLVFGSATLTDTFGNNTNYLNT